MNDFSTQQIKMFKKLFAHPPVATEFGIPEKFLLQYVLFEALVRLIGKYYRERNPQKKNSNEHTPIKHPAASSEVLKALFRLLVFNQPSPQGARN